MAKAKDVDVNVVLLSDNPVQFRIEPSPPGSLPQGPNGELIFDNNNFPGFKISFQLKDPNGLGYQFPPNAKKDEAVWSKVGNGACPAQACSEVLHAVKVEPGRMTLVVNNPNPSPAQGSFGYTLRVTKDNGNSYLDLDPGGINNNGPQLAALSPVLVFVAGAVTGSLLTIGTETLLGV